MVFVDLNCMVELSRRTEVLGAPAVQNSSYSSYVVPMQMSVNF